jgi:hypothetical protein
MLRKSKKHEVDESDMYDETTFNEPGSSFDYVEEGSICECGGEMKEGECMECGMKEETIYDIDKKKKITSQEFISKYLKGVGMKMISSLNNKIIVQEEEKIHLFTTKSESESQRFLDCLSLYFFKNKRGDCLFVKDHSTPQKKYLYDLLESKGISKKILYRKFTSLPPSSSPQPK